ncbi:Protein slit [Eumeta japonica]|uniref:Protein slit n=1 Tax=Eumeta variegata TaxID=151549 RepID=A0A4C1Y4F2_EUMVA|nr:Protein slit [Eumeta japonica]
MASKRAIRCLFLAIVGLFVCGPGASRGTMAQCPWACSCQGVLVDCSHRGLFQVPKNLPADAERMSSIAPPPRRTLPQSFYLKSRALDPKPPAPAVVTYTTTSSVTGGLTCPPRHRSSICVLQAAHAAVRTLPAVLPRVNLLCTERCLSFGGTNLIAVFAGGACASPRPPATLSSTTARDYS